MQQAVPVGHMPVDVATYAVNSDFLFEFIVIGDEKVGKSCILQRFSADQFEDSYTSTIGVNFKIRCVEVNYKQIKLQLWDTAGQERFKTITTTYYRGAHGVLFVYDVTNQESFDHIEKWLSEFREYGSKETGLILVGNKSDLEDERKIHEETAKTFADKNGMLFLETSAKTSFNIENAFCTLSERVMKKTNSCVKSGHGEPVSTIDVTENNKKVELKNDGNVVAVGQNSRNKNKKQSKNVPEKMCAGQFKVIVVGDSQVGKSSVLRRYVENEFSDSYMCTIGVDFQSKTIPVDEKHFKLSIWDTAGQERFRNITKSYYRGATGVILMYDVTSQNSFDNLQKWHEDVKQYTDPDVRIILLGNKSDAEDMRVVEYSTAKKFAEKINIPYIETSALSDTNVDEAFDQLTQEMHKWWETTEASKTNDKPKQQTVQKQSQSGRRYDFLMRLLLLGDASVGKTCLLQKYVEGDFSLEYLPTIGVDFKTKDVKFNKYVVCLQVWDTAGQERFRTITTAYYRGTAGILIIFDVTCQESFDHVPQWLEDVKQYGSETVQCVLVGNKADLTNQRVIDYNKAKEFADQEGLKYVETSAKTSLNVKEAFRTLMDQVDQHNDSMAIINLSNTSLAKAKAKKSSICSIL